MEIKSKIFENYNAVILCQKIENDSHPNAHQFSGFCFPFDSTACGQDRTDFQYIQSQVYYITHLC